MFIQSLHIVPRFFFYCLGLRIKVCYSHHILRLPGAPWSLKRYHIFYWQTIFFFFFFSKSKALIYHCESFSFSRNMFSWVSLIMALIADSELSLDLVNLWSCALWMRSLEKCNISVRRAGSSMKTRRKDDIEVTVTRDGAARPPARVVRL